MTNQRRLLTSEKVKLLYPELHPEDALYALYRQKNCNCAEVARYISDRLEHLGIRISRSGVWREIEKIEKNRMINGFGNGGPK